MRGTERERREDKERKRKKKKRKKRKREGKERKEGKKKKNKCCEIKKGTFDLLEVKEFALFYQWKQLCLQTLVRCAIQLLL